jgi:thiamine-phosphate pyrophosphorylase
MIHKLQYISGGKHPVDHIRNIKQACAAGVKWIQLRLKNINNANYLAYAMEARMITKQYGAILIINDNFSVANSCGADGIHVGLDDISPMEIRKNSSRNLIIGGTANTWEQVEQRLLENVDYIGVGPFNYTTTKTKLSPILGVEGFEKIMTRINRINVKAPVIAIGGIELADISPVMKTGVHGIAVSGLITTAPDKVVCVKSINAEIELSKSSSYATAGH